MKMCVVTLHEIAGYAYHDISRLQNISPSRSRNDSVDSLMKPKLLNTFKCTKLIFS